MKKEEEEEMKRKKKKIKGRRVHARSTASGERDGRSWTVGGWASEVEEERNLRKKNLRLRKRGLSCNGNKGEKEKKLNNLYQREHKNKILFFCFVF